MSHELESGAFFDLRKVNFKLLEKMQKIFHTIQDRVFPGSIITRECLENCLGIPYDPEDWKFREGCILLRQQIKAKGYFTEDKGCTPPEFRIVESEKMADFAKKRLIKNLISNYEVAYVMAAHDKRNMTDAQRKEHDKVQIQAAQTALWQQKMLFQNSLF